MASPITMQRVSIFNSNLYFFHPSTFLFVQIMSLGSHLSSTFIGLPNNWNSSSCCSLSTLSIFLPFWRSKRQFSASLAPSYHRKVMKALCGHKFSTTNSLSLSPSFNFCIYSLRLLISSLFFGFLISWARCSRYLSSYWLSNWKVFNSILKWSLLSSSEIYSNVFSL